MSKQKDRRSNNPYIPKYIASRPWYQENQNSAVTVNEEEIASGTDGANKAKAVEGARELEETEMKYEHKKADEQDYLSHHRKSGGIVDYSLAREGSGINDEFDGTIRKGTETDDYDTKRDRWYGYSTEEWLEQVKKWRKNNTTDNDAHVNNNDSDDTDYELELYELGLDRDEVMSNRTKQDPMEKMLRDRQDVPAYIHKINSRKDGKITLDFDYDPKTKRKVNIPEGFVNDQTQFVKKMSGEAQKLSTLQQFAWELDKKDLESRRIQDLMNSEGTTRATDLGNSLEASPTLMMMKAKQAEEAAKERSIAKRKKLLEMYSND
ncbi:mRNA splicing protein [Lodderomyces elongisporus]|uniref:mRNA splicing protein n=1 Tax=Lodderomyces elongisporus TaxID=36914 RepID=UPI00291E8067|nr:mRNA splicing protein [Lodderomyces elongisporus]WLF80057.1 mRNA splicing protein [Lodderomyces elongisporus]